MSLKPSIGQIVNPFFLQDGQDANPSAVSYPLNVADGVKGGSSAVDPLSLDIAGLPTGTLATTTELAINNGTVNEKTTLSDLATFLDGRDVYSVADITALNAITGMDTGDVAIVADTFDDTGENIAGSYIYNGTTWLLQSWYNVYLNTLLDVNAPSPVAGDILQWDGTQWVNVANAFAPLNGTPTEVRYFDNAGVDHSDPLFTRDSVTNHTEATRDYNSTSSTINTATVPVQFLTQNTNGTFNIGDQVETQFGEAQAEVLDVGTVTTTEPQYTNLAYSGVGLNDLTSIYAGGYTGGIFPVSYTVDVLQNNVAYSSIAMLSGIISIGDTITGLTSGATATVVAIDQFKNILAVDTIIGTFIPAEIVQGNTPSDFISILGDFSTLADIVVISNTNANSIVTTIAHTSQLEGVQISFSSFTGHTIGDTWTFDISPTSTYFVVYLTNVTGILPITKTRLNNLTTPFQTDDGDILAAQFTIGDTVNVIDLSAGFTVVGNINITQVSGSIFTYTVNSGTIAIGNYLYGPSLGKVGFIYNLTSNIINKTINTGFRTEPIQFPNVPFIIEGSAIVATDGVDKMAVGVFDLSVSGQSELSAGIEAHYATGESVALTLQNNDLFIEVYDGASDSYLQSASPTTFTLKNTISGIEHGISQSSGAVTLGNLSGGNNTKITINDVAQTINFNGEYSFPFADGTSGQALVTDGAGTLSWASAGGGGSPAGSNNQIQINQSSAFFADSTFQKSDTDFNVGLDRTTQSAVTFTGSGLDNLTLFVNVFSGTYPTTYTVAIDGVNKDVLQIQTSTITGGSFAVADTITNGLGGSATIDAISTLPSDDKTVLIISSVSGSFSAGNTIDNGLGVTGTSATGVQTYDTITWTDGTTTVNNTIAVDSNGVIAGFSAPTGHTLSDSWTWTYSYANQNVLDFSNNDYKFSATIGTDTFGYQISDNLFGFGLLGSLATYQSGSDMGLSGFWKPGGVLTLESSLILAGSQTGFRSSNNVVTLGNLASGNNTKITVDDVTQLITVSNVPTYADDAAATTGGLTTGQLYKTTTLGTTSLNIVP